MAWYDKVGLAIGGGNNYDNYFGLDGIYKDGWVPDGGTYSDGLGNMVKTPDFTNESFDLSSDRYSDIMDNLREDGLGGVNSVWGKNGMLPTLFQGLSAAGGLMQAYAGLKGLALQKEQLNNAKNAFRTQFEANKTSLGEGVRNAAATNYAMHRGTARDFNENEQKQVANTEANRVMNSYKNYV